MPGPARPGWLPRARASAASADAGAPASRIHCAGPEAGIDPGSGVADVGRSAGPAEGAHAPGRRKGPRAASPAVPLALRFGPRQDADAILPLLSIRHPAEGGAMQARPSRAGGM